MQEAKIAGEEFFYSIPFKDKEGNVKAVEDGGIDLAYDTWRLSERKVKVEQKGHRRADPIRLNLFVSQRFL